MLVEILVKGKRFGGDSASLIRRAEKTLWDDPDSGVTFLADNKPVHIDRWVAFLPKPVQRALLRNIILGLATVVNNGETP